MQVPRAIGMDVDLTPLLDQLEPVIHRRRHGDELCVLITDVVHAYRHVRIGEKAAVPQQAEGESIATDDQLGRRDQWLERPCHRRRQLARRGRPRRTEPAHRDSERAEDDAGHSSTMTCPYIQGCGRQM